MAALEALDKAINEHDSSTSESVTGSVDSVQRMPDLLVESTNNAKANSEATAEATEAAELNNNKTNNLHQSKVYASVAEMKRMKVRLFLDVSKLVGNGSKSYFELIMKFHANYWYILR